MLASSRSEHETEVQRTAQGNRAQYKIDSLAIPASIVPGMQRDSCLGNEPSRFLTTTLFQQTQLQTWQTSQTKPSKHHGIYISQSDMPLNAVIYVAMVRHHFGGPGTAPSPADITVCRNRPVLCLANFATSPQIKTDGEPICCQTCATRILHTGVWKFTD